MQELPKANGRAGYPRGHGNPDHRPSVRIAVAARLHETGIWPLTQSCHEYVPKDKTPNAAVVLFQGTGRDGRSMPDICQATADRHDPLLIAPNGGPLRFSALGRSAVTTAARDAAMAHGLSAEGFFIDGLSNGAVSAKPDLRRAAALHAGYRPAADLGTAATDSPLRLDSEGHDPIFPTAPARPSLAAMAVMGRPRELLQIKGHGHWFYGVKPQRAGQAAEPPAGVFQEGQIRRKEKSQGAAAFGLAPFQILTFAPSAPGAPPAAFPPTSGGTPTRRGQSHPFQRKTAQVIAAEATISASAHR